MPPSPPVNGVVRARLEATLSGVSAGHRLFFGVSSTYPFTNAQCSALADAIMTPWVANLAGYAMPNYEFNRVVVEDLSTGSAAIGISSVAGGPGSRAGTELSNNAAVGLNFGIGSRYRGGHPRIVLPPLSQGDMVAQTSWNTGILVAIEEAFNTFITAVTSSAAAAAMGITHHVSVVYSRNHIPSIPPQPYNVQSYVAMTRIASMRRRL